MITSSIHERFAQELWHHLCHTGGLDGVENFMRIAGPIESYRSWSKTSMRSETLAVRIDHKSGCAIQDPKEAAKYAAPYIHRDLVSILFGRPEDCSIFTSEVKSWNDHGAVEDLNPQAVFPNLQLMSQTIQRQAGETLSDALTKIKFPHKDSKPRPITAIIDAVGDMKDVPPLGMVDGMPIQSIFGVKPREIKGMILGPLQDLIIALHSVHFDRTPDVWTISFALQVIMRHQDCFFTIRDPE